MMLHPPISSLLSTVDSKYTLVVEVAKRARQINEGSEVLTKCDSEKPVSIAIHEVYDKKIFYKRNYEKIKHTNSPREIN